MTKTYENDSSVGFLKVCCFSVTIVYWSIITSISQVPVTLSLCKESIFASLTLLLQGLCNCPGMLSVKFWATYLTDGSSFLHCQCLDYARTCAFLFARPSLDNWQVLHGIKVWRVSCHPHIISMFCSPSLLVITFAFWHVLPSCWKRCSSSPNFVDVWGK